MKWFIIIIMTSVPGERTDYYLYDKMPFNEVEECQAFGQMYWQPLTNLAVMKYKGKKWDHIFCIPEENATRKKIEMVLNGKGV